MLVVLFEIIIVAFLVGIILNHYGNWRKQQIVVLGAAFLAWYFSQLIIFLLPVDISSTFYRQCMKDETGSSLTTPRPSVGIVARSVPHNGSTTAKVNGSLSRSNFSSQHATGNATRQLPNCEIPWTYVPMTVLPVLWRIIYWSSQMLTWILLPMMQSYAKSGHFTVAGRLRSALIDNAIYYGTYLLIFGVILIYIATQPEIRFDAGKLKIIGITASNTWGMCLIVLFLGFGLVEVPRSVWRSGCPEVSLRKAYFHVAKVNGEKVEMEENLEDVINEVKKISFSIPQSHFLRKNLEVIFEKCADIQGESSYREPSRERNPITTSATDAEPGPVPTSKTLVKLHTKLIRAKHLYGRTSAQRQEALRAAAWLEDVDNNSGSRLRHFRSGPLPVVEEGEEGWLRRVMAESGVVSSLEWHWKCVARPLALKALSIVLLLMSALVVWSECTFSVRTPVLSFFAVLVDLAASNYSYFLIEVVTFCTIGYLTLCIYYTVFKIRIFNYFTLVPNHQTDENSLIFSGMLLCRLTPPLCLNFLGLIHLDSHVTKSQSVAREETAYTHIMGHLDVVKIVADGFNLYFPIAICLLCVATYLRLGSRCLSFLGVQQFLDNEDEVTQEMVEEGRILVKRERQLWDRQRRLLDSRGPIEMTPDLPKRSDDRQTLLRGRTASADYEDFVEDENDPLNRDPFNNHHNTRSGHRPIARRDIFDDI